MPQVKKTYTDRYSWGSSNTNSSNRPYTWMRIHGPGGASMDLWALLDTGADYLMLERAVATRVGLNLSSLPCKNINVAGGGTISVTHATGIQITVEGNSAIVDVLFGGKGTPLLGRTAIIRTIDFGIDNIGWLHL